jgi:uncharacterized protein YlxW (UPF0749 family)
MSERRAYGPEFLTDLFRFPLDPGYADAAARRERRGPRVGWRAGTVQAVSLATLALIGFLLAVAYRQTVADEPERSRAHAGLVRQVNERQDITDALQARVDRLRDEVARQRDAALDDKRATELRTMEATTGLAKVRGDGVVVRVDDADSAPDAVTGAKGADLSRVYDRDLQDIVNALWSGGAEAIAINGQRLTATSTIRAAGRAILVDFRPITRPYQVSAIGPKDLDRRFAGSKAAALFRNLVDAYGMKFEVRKADDLTLPAAAEPRLHYAQSAAEPTSSPHPTPSTSPTGGGR